MEKYTELMSLGIEDIARIERYNIRREGDKDILKIYFCKDKKALFAKSVKFKYPCQRKIYGIGDQELVMNPKLQLVESELQEIFGTRHDTVSERDLKKKILSDLRHLEQVVHSKITEIEKDLAKLGQKH